MNQTATILTMQNVTTWETLRLEYGKMSHMGWQSVLQAAKVGAMLIELKKDCPHKGDGNFNLRVKVEMPDLIPKTRCQLMLLAQNLPLLKQHTPDSQSAALSLISEHKPFKIGWAKLLTVRLGIYRPTHKTDAKKKLEEKLGLFPIYFTNEADADAFVNNYLRIIGLEKIKPTREELSTAQQKKLDTAIKIEYARLQQQYQAEMSAEINKRMADREARCDALEDKAREREAQCSAAMARLDSIMTQDEFRFILNCLHPDRAPEDRKERFGSAFVIFKRLESSVNHSLPLSILRERGWGR